MAKAAGAEKLARIFGTLSSPARVRIVQLLSGDVLCVGALSRRLGVTPAAVSQHLRILRDAGLVVSEKRGYYVHYRLNRKTLAQWGNAIGRLVETAVTTAPKRGDDPECRKQRKEDPKCRKRRKAASTRRS